MAALHRELAEELGVAVVVDEELRNREGRCWPISADHEMRVWLGMIIDGTPRPDRRTMCCPGLAVTTLLRSPGWVRTWPSCP